MRGRPAALATLALATALALGSCGGGGDSTSAGAREQGSRTVPLEISGAGAAQFRVEGGDNSVANYGDEAEAGELRQAAEAVHAYFTALAREEWRDACSYLSRQELANLARLAARSHRGGCAPLLGKLFGRVSAAEAREVSVVVAAALRREGTRGFLLYRGAKGRPYFMSLVREGDRWVIAGLSPSGLG